MAQEKKYIPELRFPEFKNDGKWNSDTMENIFDLDVPLSADTNSGRTWFELK